MWVDLLIIFFFSSAVIPNSAASFFFFSVGWFRWIRVGVAVLGMGLLALVFLLTVLAYFHERYVWIFPLGWSLAC